MTSGVSDLLELGIQETGEGFRQKRWSPVEVTAAALARIEATEPDLHAWVVVDAERALAGARQAERELMAWEDRGTLHGIPVGIKDIYDVAGLPTRCGSEARADAPAATASAPTVAR